MSARYRTADGGGFVSVDQHPDPAALIAMLDTFEPPLRAAGLGGGVTFRVADALALPYPDGAFDVCRAQAVLQHLTDPGKAVREMVRVTRPGGRVGVLEYDLGTLLLDHADRPATETILRGFRDAMAQPWIGRQAPRLFRQAGLTGA